MTPQYLGENRKSDPNLIVNVRSYDSIFAQEQSPHIYIKPSHILDPIMGGTDVIGTSVVYTLSLI